MRRQDRRVTDIEEIKGILNSTRIIHLGMMDGDYLISMYMAIMRGKSLV